MARKKATPKSADPPKKIETVRHKDKRANIPTEELRDFVAQEEQSPFVVRYPRNPDLDPQLVWKGKDQQDSHPLEVPAVPIYIQEKVHPQAIIEDFLATSGKEAEKPRDAQLSLFSDFNGLPDDFDKRVDFYHHEGNWSNRLILGNSELVMTSLAEKEGLKGRVQMIYIDPPYGIRFPSNWQVSTRKRDVKDGKIEDMVRQPEQVQAFRDTWKLGIHSYLPYLRDRLVVARELLTESGSLFVQIGDENVHHVRELLDEVFGPENSISLITVRKTGGTTGAYLPATADFILWYGKNVERLKYRGLFALKSHDGADTAAYNLIELPDGTRRKMASDERKDAESPSVGRRFQMTILTSPRIREARTGYYPILFQGTEYLPTTGEWKTHRNGIARLAAAFRIDRVGTTLRYVRYLDDFPATSLTNTWTDLGGASDPVYVVQTNNRILERCLLMTTDPGDLVLDPTCGSGTTAYVAEQWGRRWITIDTSRVSLTLARTRLMAARFPYYLLSDTPEGVEKEADLAGQLPPRPLPTTEGDIRKGFVYKRVPHITLKAIANNEEIDTIHAKWQETLEPLRKKLNAARKKKWEEWEIPRAAEDPWPSAAQTLFYELHNELARAEDARQSKIADYLADINKNLKRSYAVETLPQHPVDPWPESDADLLAEWWDARQQRQREIDASIARRADTEMLYDQPYEQNKRVRVTGPFTVESLSPHRTISVEEKKRRVEEGDPKFGLKIATFGPDQFGNMILDNLRTAGVQNTIKKERLRFDSLQPYAGQWIHGEGSYTEAPSPNGRRRGEGEAVVKRVAVCIGPEHGTVGPQLVKEAAKEAVRGVGFDLLIVCGFAFDPHVSEETKRYGNLTVLPTRMNPDLTMGDLLKKTGSGNLFMVFGEPDLDITHQKDGRIVVELRGLDIFDPTTGEIRSSSTDDIACWFIDTSYNGESFFVRHAYFTGADEPYDKLKRALRAEIDEAAWSALYSTTSRPFDRPETGKIAVKVINHYGDEVLKVFDV